MTPQAQNRVTAALATSIFLLLSLLLANFSSQQSSDYLLRRPSTFFTDPSGARALFLVMKQFLPETAQWRRPLYLLPLPDRPGAPSTLIVAGPARPISAREADYLRGWLSAGGQLILLNDNGWPLAPKSTRDRPGSTNDKPVAKGDQDQPSTTFLSRYAPDLRWSKVERNRTRSAAGSSLAAKQLTLQWQRSFSAIGNSKVIAEADKTNLAVELPVGRGRIIAVADPAMVSNGALRRSDNAVWLVDLAAAWGNGKTLFDEYHHGFGQKRSTLELTRAFLLTPWGWCVLQIAVAGMLYLLVYRRRFGRIREPPPSQRASPLELLDARAGVFQAAAAQSLSAELIVQHLCQSLTQSQGKTVDSANLSRELASLAKSRGIVAAALQSLFGKIQNGRRLSDREFIELGRGAGEIIRGTRP
ncbi:MAG: DUF4350 domain-containing protein [Chloroflexota bacterium]